MMIVLTGGPSAGKTRVTEDICRMGAGSIVPVAEAATQVYTTHDTRWDLLDVEHRRAVQLEIYHFQRAQEARAEQDNPGKLLLLDRGTIDGSAYWPDGPAAYWEALGVNARDELLRYDAIIWLGSSASLGIYDGEASNQVRFESPEEAVASGDVLRQLYNAHPRYFEAPAEREVSAKVSRVWQIIRDVAGDLLPNEPSA